MKKSLARIYVPGGILSPGELRRIANTAHYIGADHIHLGNRQDILLWVDQKYAGELRKRLDGGQYEFEIGEEQEHANIMTSFATRNVFNTTSWLTEGVYLEILSGFRHTPRLKVNITDPLQALVPLFSGDLNFVASHQDNYWFLFIRFPQKEEMGLWPVLVDGNEIAALSEAIEKLLLAKKNMNLIQLETYIYNIQTWNFRIIDVPFTRKNARFPHYEGFHAMGERYWLGIYQRDNAFTVNFIDNLCILCSETSIGSINITPWASFLIKNIDEKHIEKWEWLFGKHGINTGHSQLELNWQTPELDREAKKVKQFIYQSFEKTGLRTDGLVFGISPEPADMYASIMIRRKSYISLPGNINLFSNYEVKYKQGFDPNGSSVISFADGLKKRNLPAVLSYLCSLYYESLNRNMGIADMEKPSPVFETKIPVEKDKKVYQCRECLTVYDPSYGDGQAGVPAGISFRDLPNDYKCSLCEASKESFAAISAEKLLVN